MRAFERHARCRHGVGIRMKLLCATFAIWPLSAVQGMQTSATLRLVGSQFHQKDPEDAGQARITIQNTGEAPLSLAQLRVRVRAKKTTDPAVPTVECRSVYVKLSPPVLPRGQHGEIVAALLDRPPQGSSLMCDVSTTEGADFRAVPLAEPDLWISYVGFSGDLRKVFVYVENAGPEPAEARLLTVGQSEMAKRAPTIHFSVPPKDKRCLTGDLPHPLTKGQFVHVVVAASVGGRETKLHATVRAIRTVPIVTEFDAGDSGLGLDVQRPFVQTMVCPAHAHGSPEAAAAKFLRDYLQRFSKDPGQVIQVAICRSGLPKAWFRFGGLPDVGVVNTALRPPSRYDADPQKWFRVGDLAKRATEPGRYLAIIPTGPAVEEHHLLLKGLSSQEWRFLVYGAIASGAKGIVYRGSPGSDTLSRNAFVQTNRELQYVRPLLLIGEPVDWATSSDDGYAARSLLCGDQAILVVVFDCRYFSGHKSDRFYTPPFPTKLTPVPVHVKIPSTVLVEGVRTPFTSLDRRCWECRDDTLDLTADMLDSAQMYIVSVRSRNRPSERGLLP